MPPDLAAKLLAARDQAEAASAPARCLALLVATAQADQASDLPNLPVGECDRRLLELRRALLGDRMAAVAQCPGCGEMVETTFPLPALALPAATVGAVTVRAAGWVVTARLPTLADQCAAATTPGIAAARALLLARCVLHATHGTEASGGALPEPVAAAVARALAEADPQADIELLLHCPACEAAALLPFDIGSFLWRELDHWAGRLLREVHELARAYGWSEGAILALSAHRRRHYLALLAS